MSQATALYLGVDAGNSKTDALVCDASGRVAGRGRSGCGDIYAGLTAAVESVLAAVDAALTEAATTPSDIARAAFRLAGVDWPEDHALWTDTIGQRLPTLRSHSIANDGFAAIRCGEPSGVAVAIVAGTGSAVVGRGPTGAEWSLSFWIEGGMGAGGLVADALRAVYDADLGLGPPTVLTERLLTYFGHPSVDDLLHGHTRRRNRHPGPTVAGAAPEVTRAAGAGDTVAIGILEDHARRYADYALVVADRVGFDVDAGSVPVVLAGAVLAAPDSPLAAAVRTALAARFPVGSVRPAQMSPVAGAALDALAESGVSATPPVIAALTEALHSE